MVNPAPQLSIIVPYYNNDQTLAKLLDSVLSQSFKELEIIIVDDCSEAKPDFIIDEYRACGLNIQLIRHLSRQQTKNARLTGVDAAKAEIITFYDADDFIYGDELEGLVNKFKNEKPDVLHFKLKIFGPDGLEIKKHNFNFARPYAQKLTGRNAFRQYVKNNCAGHIVCAKLFSRTVWQKIRPLAQAIDVHRYCEDFFLYTLVASQTQLYLSCEVPAYGYNLSQDFASYSQRKGLGNAVTLLRMQKELIPAWQKQGYDEKILAQLNAHLKKRGLDSLQAYAQYIKNSGLSPELPKLEADESIAAYLEAALAFLPPPPKPLPPCLRKLHKLIKTPRLFFQDMKKN